MKAMVVNVMMNYKNKGSASACGIIAIKSYDIHCFCQS